jgi:hypothetical protein
MPLTLDAIHRYPVKGLSGQPLQRVALHAGEALPLDRAWALAHGASQFDPAAPAWVPKRNFLNLMRHERLAQLSVDLDEETHELVIARDGKPVARGVIATAVGVGLINQFFAAFMKGEGVGAPRLVHAPGLHFTDTRTPYVSIINLASVADLQRVARRPVDARRFRGNLLVSGADAWAEMAWIGRVLAIGDARLKVEETIGRCAATAVDPQTAVRDLNVPGLLSDGYGHTDCGVYCTVVQAGTIAPGDPVKLMD